MTEEIKQENYTEEENAKAVSAQEKIQAVLGNRHPAFEDKWGDIYKLIGEIKGLYPEWEYLNNCLEEVKKKDTEARYWLREALSCFEYD